MGDVKVYAAINAVQAALSKEGISKTRKNVQQGYSFRGIDEVMNALAPILANAKLCILPRVLARETTERQTKAGGVLFATVLDMEFDIVHAEDGSKHTVRVVGEAMDSADKSCNKAMSAGYKYAAFQTFCIPTEGDNDADAVTHDAGERVTTPVAHKPSMGVITEPQRKRAYAIATEHGWGHDEVKALLKRTLGVESSAQIPANRYDEFIRLLEAGVDSLVNT